MKAEIKALHEQAAAARKAFREAVKSGDIETAHSELEKLINAHSSINDKKESKLQVLDKLIDILS
jgi:Zn-dependent M32 family carboxypeptidase